MFFWSIPLTLARKTPFLEHWNTNICGTTRPNLKSKLFLRSSHQKPFKKGFKLNYNSIHFENLQISVIQPNIGIEMQDSEAHTILAVVW